uniref:hypothetical protein n=1 Tax=Rhodanobacter glycinis TaxID=582702 RepID=UPI00155AB5F7|nr:hypothetical protein [Rhodanobacter glycinis]
MKFSDALNEYLELREAGAFESDWCSIDEVSHMNSARQDRMQELLDAMDAIVATAV